MTGPRDLMVISMRSRWSASRGLRSWEHSTSTLITFGSSFSIFDSFSAMCMRKRSETSVFRPLTTMSTK